MPITSSALRSIRQQIANQHPYNLLEQDHLDDFLHSFQLFKYAPGQVLLRPDELPSSVFLILHGKVRMLAKNPDTNEPITLALRGSGQLFGWVSLLRGDPCEWVTASEETTAIAVPSEQFLSAIFSSEGFSSFFFSTSNIHESYKVLSSFLRYKTQIAVSDYGDLLSSVDNCFVCSFPSGSTFSPPKQLKKASWFVSTAGVPNLPLGSSILHGYHLPLYPGYKLPLRFICTVKDTFNSSKSLSPSTSILETSLPDDSLPSSSLISLGILEEDSLEDDQRYPFCRGIGPLKEALAVCNMICLSQNTPFRKDILEKFLESQFRRNKALSLELLARLCEILGLNCQIAAIDVQHIHNLEFPVIFIFESTPCVLYGVSKSYVLVANPTSGLDRIPIESFKSRAGSRVRFALPRRLQTTPTSRFGWSWFTPLIVKYKRSLALVFLASLLSQLFGLAIPLLIQQIIDKVLSQGNLSSLNVLGTLMIILALFQGILNALRTYVFVDTTDRMDLALGSAVIDRLLSLPLGFFEKRPVGELSQRVGELNAIRGFLTGTALVSVLNIVFASLYLVVMLLYSPLLTAVALSTFPLYLLLVFGVAPIYRFLLRKRAVAQAKTQSHLIEVLGGIQTVKAQHFELTARWKWQDRYRVFVDHGFKSVALGASSGEVGGFLNTLSGLLVLWVGMFLVLRGELTLGMLIAFRIIAGNVTGPLLQLSSLYQGFQKVQISMERIADIIDQNSELSDETDLEQIPLPSISGAIRFENVSFRFGANGPYQVDNVSLSICPGHFVGIVGQSGSGKSTLMKLLPRLYSPNMGRIFIDDYDIAKVNLSSLRRQIGIVPQDSLLFEGTISENIALNDPEASADSIILAAKIACAHDFIMSLGQGYATPLSEKGSNLSGGQRQRIAIARTILSNPQLLVMDEATSALDYNTERQLCLNLQDWAKDRTVLFITHRLSSIRNSDQIILMNQGRVLEQGTHEELMLLNQRYSALYKQQDS